MFQVPCKHYDLVLDFQNKLYENDPNAKGMKYVDVKTQVEEKLSTSGFIR